PEERVDGHAAPLGLAGEQAVANELIELLIEHALALLLDRGQVRGGALLEHGQRDDFVADRRGGILRRLTRLCRHRPDRQPEAADADAYDPPSRCHPGFSSGNAYRESS